MLNKLLSFFKNRRVLLALIGSAILAALVYGLVSERPTQSQPLPGKPGQASSSEGITPGKSDITDLEKLGKPREVIQGADGTVTHLYGLKTDPRPIEVLVKDGRVIFLKKRPTLDDPALLEGFVKQFGLYDFSLYSGGYGFKAYVFLTSGLVVVAQEEKGDILELRYFVPTSKEGFLETWGKDFSEVTPTYPPGYY